MENLIILIWTGILGLILGSFLNVCIYRIPRGESIISPPSYCPNCRERINWRDNIPILSYILLKGKCRKCNDKIPVSYLAVEFLSAFILCINYIVFGTNKDFFLFSILFLSLLAVAFIDFEKGIIPNKIIVFGVLIGLIFSISGGLSAFKASLIGSLLGGFMLYLIRLIGNKFLKQESMGWGDVKLGCMVGIFLGVKLTLISIYFAFIISMFFGLYLIIKKKSLSIRPIPLGTFISVGVYICVFYGEKIYNHYLNLFT